jgi:3-oxoacyl-[acyl-carrier protein] reductase
MNDRYLELSQSGWGKSMLEMFGLPTPPRLARADGAWADRPFEGQAILVGAAAGSEACEPLLRTLDEAGAKLRVITELPGLPALKKAAAALKLNLAANPQPAEGADRAFALVFDATGLAGPDQLRELYDFFQPQIAALPSNGRALILGRAPEEADTPAAAAAAAALIGFAKSLGKEIGRKGTTVNLIELEAGADASVAGAVRFLLSKHSAYISGQVLRVGQALRGSTSQSWSQPFAGKSALVTGAARGIGASIAEVLAREGAHVIGVDHPTQEGALAETMAKVAGSGIAVDITAKDAADRIARAVSGNGTSGGLDVVVHNAGVTRDKMLRNMPPHLWDMVLQVNLASIVRMNERFMDGVLKNGARMVCISSIGGIGGNAGQTNYGATKAGIIGYVAALADAMAKKGGAVNAVAPGFIETQMTAQMPLGPREVGRRLAALGQGGLPIDIAEAVMFLGSSHAAGVNGRTLRVCGQNFFGA